MRDRPNDGPDKKVTKGASSANRPTKEEQMKLALHTPGNLGYKDEPGVYLFPVSGIHKAISKLGGRVVTAWPQTVLRSVISLSGDWFHDEQYTQIMSDAEPRIFTAIAVTKGMSRAPYTCHRARFSKGWRCCITLQTVEQAISTNDCLELLQLAGQVNGIGSFRPENSGTFGRFQILPGEANHKTIHIAKITQAKNNPVERLPVERLPEELDESDE